jgi:hypothetical protein
MLIFGCLKKTTIIPIAGGQVLVIRPDGRFIAIDKKVRQVDSIPNHVPLYP